MIENAQRQIAIGWDVGGWNCDKNRDSRDALVMRDSNGALIGAPWRGNMRYLLNVARSTNEFVRGLLDLCRVPKDFFPDEAVIAIDAPLAFPSALIALLSGRSHVAQIGANSENPYLYRFTERRLALPTSTPLSVVKDMIGSQSSKAIHAVRRFAPTQNNLGVWSYECALRMIETYPAACRRRFSAGESPAIVGASEHDDIRDADLCAWVAKTFMCQPAALEFPPADAPPDEGWIWLPIDASKRAH